MTSEVAILGGEPVRSLPYPDWPVFSETDSERLKIVLHKGVWSAVDGEEVGQFESEFANYHDSEYGIACMNGTVSLEIALRSLGIGAGDEVIVPPYTFLATASAVLAVNALPIFADIEEDTYNLDPESVKKMMTPRTKAIIAVHLGGHPVDWTRLSRVASERNIPIIEDAAHAHGAVWKGRKVGSLGVFSSFSFQATKNMASGEGGILLSNDAEMAKLAWSFHNCGRTSDGPWYEHYELGGNYRLTEFQSAILRSQLARLDSQMTLREKNASYLSKELAGLEGITPPQVKEYVDRHAYHLYIFRFNSAAFGNMSRDVFVQAMSEEGIPVSAGYPYPLYRQPLFQSLRFDTKATHYNPSNENTNYASVSLPVVEQACKDVVWVPQNLLLGTEQDMTDIVESIKKIQNNCKQIVKSVKNES